MAGPQELPELIRDFVEMAKSYLRQETLDPAKALGRFGGFSIAAGIVWSIAAVMLVVAGHRVILQVFPDRETHQIWSGLAFIVSGLVWFLCAGIVAWGASRGAVSSDTTTVEPTETAETI